MLIYWNGGHRRYSSHPVRPYRRRVWEFQAVLDGMIRPYGVDVGDSKSRGRTLWLFAPDNVHGWTGDNRSAQIAVFHFSQIPEPLQAVIADRSWIATSISGSEVEEIEGLLTDARWAFRERTALSTLYMRMILDKLAIIVCRQVAPTAPPPEGDREQIIVERAEAIIQAETDAEFSIRSLAQRLGTSESHLRRVFVAVRGYPPQKAKERIIMERARLEIIREADLSILDVALAYGYGSHSAFTKAYSRYWGESPLKTRRLHLKRS